MDNCVRDKTDLPKHFCYNFHDSAAVIFLETHNVKQTHCLIFCFMVKMGSKHFASSIESWQAYTN